MQIGERIDQRKADTAVEFRAASEFGRDVVADRKAVPAFLDEEQRADDALVFAEQEAPRRLRDGHADRVRAAPYRAARPAVHRSARPLLESSRHRIGTASATCVLRHAPRLRRDTAQDEEHCWWR